MSKRRPKFNKWAKIENWWIKQHFSLVLKHDSWIKVCFQLISEWSRWLTRFQMANFPSQCSPIVGCFAGFPPQGSPRRLHESGARDILQLRNSFSSKSQRFPCTLPCKGSACMISYGVFALDLRSRCVFSCVMVQGLGNSQPNPNRCNKWCSPYPFIPYNFPKSWGPKPAGKRVNRGPVTYISK